jgi:hypothetical protein
MKPKGIHWEKFKAIHSEKTSAWIYENFGKTVSKEQFVKAHLGTCKSKYSPRVCGKDLYGFLIKYNWLNSDAE